MECYIIYRIHGNSEKFFGWTKNKNVLKAFLKQRDPKKYSSIKIDEDDVVEYAPTNNDKLSPNYELNFIKLRSCKTSEEIYMFSTMSELKEFEVEAQTMMQDIAAIDRIDENNIEYFVNAVLGLDQIYYDALYYLGYRPKEISALFDSVMGETVYDRIGYAYDYMPCEEYYYNYPDDQMPGLSALDDVSNKILYSIECFIKVMRKDL